MSGVTGMSGSVSGQYHFKSFIHNIAKATDDVNNNGNNADTTDTDLINGNLKHFNNSQLDPGKIRITENPLPENILNC